MKYDKFRITIKLCREMPGTNPVDADIHEAHRNMPSEENLRRLFLAADSSQSFEEILDEEGKIPGGFLEDLREGILKERGVS